MTQEEAMLVLGEYLIGRIYKDGLVKSSEDNVVQAVAVALEVLVNNMMGRLTPETEEVA